jgi:hypothetical protein
MGKGHDWPERAMALGCSGIGIVVGLFCAALVLIPLGQCLIDYDDDDVVLATIHYFKYGAGAFCLVCGVAGALAGKVYIRFVKRSRQTQEDTVAT